jgi:hypothetical protein
MGDIVTQFNSLRLLAYDSTGSILPMIDLAGSEKVIFETVYPGGLFSSCTFWIPKDVGLQLIVTLASRLKVFNGIAICWEGRITAIEIDVNASDQGYAVTALGYWADVMMTRSWRKWWADTRYDVWNAPISLLNSYDQSLTDVISVDTNNRIRLTPQSSQQFASGWLYRIIYNEPTGQTVKRVTFNYDLQMSAYTYSRKVYYYNGAYNNCAELTDGDPATTRTITLTTAQYIYVCIDDTNWSKYINRIRFDLGSTLNTNASVMTVKYYNGSWTSLTITDGTAVSGATLAKDGDVTFTNPGDCEETKVGSIRGHWLQISVSANLTAVIFEDISFGQSQAWELKVVSNSGEIILDATSAATGSVDHTLASPGSRLGISMISLAQQTPGTFNSIYAEISDLCVYSETGSINLTEVAKDVAGFTPELSADLSLIGSNALSLVPFISEINTAADILTIAAGFGDSSYNAWACGIRESDLSSDGDPILFAEQQPSLTDYDYVVRLEESNLAAPFVCVQDITDVRNWIAVEYQNELGQTVILTPDDDAGLMDSTSITAYGRRDEWLSLQTTSQTIAANYGKRYLAAHKNPQWRVSNDIMVLGYVRAKDGSQIPTSQIRAGKRIRVSNFMQDLNGTGLTFLISATRYEDATEICTISVGTPSSLDVWLARQSAGI